MIQQFVQGPTGHQFLCVDGRSILLSLVVFTYFLALRYQGADSGHDSFHNVMVIACSVEALCFGRARLLMPSY